MKKKLLLTLTIFAMSISFTACGKMSAIDTAKAMAEELEKQEMEALEKEAENTEGEAETVEEDTEDAEADEEYTEIGAWAHAYEEEVEGEIYEWTEYIVLNRGGVGYWVAQDCTPITFGDGVLTDGSDEPVEYVLNKDELTLTRERYEATFTRIDGAWPEELDNAIAEFESYSSEFMPNDFLQERLQKDVFESYDEIVDSLQPGEAYAYVMFKDYDSDFLVITDTAYEAGADSVSESAYIYGEVDGAIKNIGNCFSAEGYPVKTDGEYLYTASTEGYEVDCLDKDTGGLMAMEFINKTEDEAGNTVFSGFRREINSVTEDDGEDLYFDDEEIFADLIEFYNTQNPISFFVIK